MKSNNEQIEIFNNLKDSILSEINQLWTSNFKNFEIIKIHVPESLEDILNFEKYISSYKIILNDEIRIYMDDEFGGEYERLCIKKSKNSIRKSDGLPVKYLIEFYLDDDDLKKHNKETNKYLELFNLLYENKDLWNEESLLVNHISSDKDTFKDVVLDYLELRKKEIEIFNKPSEYEEIFKPFEEIFKPFEEIFKPNESKNNSNL